VKNEYTTSQLRVELALSAFLSGLSELKDIDESDIKNSRYQSRVASSLNELNEAAYFLFNPNLYRITVRDQEGAISSREIRAASLSLALKDRDEKYEVIKAERIHPLTGKVLGGFYKE
jgi:hypothetical protein